MSIYQKAVRKADLLRWDAIAETCAIAFEEQGNTGILDTLALLAPGEDVPAWVIGRIEGYIRKTAKDKAAAGAG